MSLSPIHVLRRKTWIFALLSLTLGILVCDSAPLLVQETDQSLFEKRIAGSNAWLEVDTQAFDENIKRVKEFLDGRAELCAIMKADAYGNGIVGLLPTVIDNGVKFIGITSNEEARMLRENGFEGRIVRARSASRNEIEEGIEYKIEEIIGSLEQAIQIKELSKSHGVKIPIHLVLNSTGMGRNGLEIGTETGKKEGLKIVRNKYLNIVGMMTHFPRAKIELIQAASEKFAEQTAWLIENSPLERENLTLHAASSFAAQNVPESLFDMVRIGGLLYGRTAPYERLITFKTRIASLHTFPEGSTIGYGGSAILTRDSVLANLPIGYTDGIARSLSNRGYVLINGKRARIVGVTTMNTTMVDVTDLPEVHMNDEVVLYGAQGDDFIDDRENRMHSERTLGEQATMWGASNPRVYF
ncbi:alanine racemase [Pelagicoccus albus]|uniref:Alanine racemase n=1 Tax=Pelagicoccus albus TaxID=415222 RepID=A0A7X1E7T4_9BACT|nr:alanine racemase [Pelagicoccus albus]MBC2605478.1 alanine racemase [Pelagicoccus albus]